MSMTPRSRRLRIDLRQGLGLVCAAAAVLGFVLALALTSTPPKRHQLLFLVSDPSVGKVTHGLDRLLSDEPQIARRLDVTIQSPSNTLERQSLPPHDLLLVEILDRRWVREKASQVAGTSSRRFALGPSGIDGEIGLSERLDLEQDARLNAYWENSAPGEIAMLLRHVLARYLGQAVGEIAPPAEKMTDGFIAFGADGGVVRLSTYAAWAQMVAASAGPRVAIIDYASRANAETLDLPKAMAQALADRGAAPMIVFAERVTPIVAKHLIGPDGRPRADVVISLHHKFFEEGAVATLARLGVPVLNAIRVFGRTEEEWAASTQGLTSSEVAWQLAIPELAGLAPHTVVGAIDNRGQSVAARPIAAGVARVADRAVKLAAIAKKSASDRRVAIMYWNYPPGKQNVGASYLNVVRSIPLVARRLKASGYSAPGLEALSNNDLELRVRRRGLNIGRWGPGELDRLVAEGDIVAVPIDQYKIWLEQTPSAFRSAVTRHWGPPEDADIMVREIDGRVHIILPVLRFGNVIILPQPDRGRMQDLDALYQSQELPPHHQYVAAYLWLQNAFKADTLIYMGTHGTHEWLSGKEAGLAGSDPGEVLAGDMPIVYPYIMDDVGEGIVAKRRAAATVVDHLTPALGDGGLSPELVEISDLIARWRAANSTNPDAAAALAAEIEEKVSRRGLDVDLRDRGWARRQGDYALPRPERISRLEDYIAQIAAQTVPLGLHTFGVTPEPDRLDRFVAALRATSNKDETGRQDTQSGAIRTMLEQTAASEWGGLFQGLSAGFVTPGPGNDPMRNPEALPTGRNFFTFDPRTIPMPAADELGVRLARDMLEQQRAQTGQWPQKIALQLWGVETLRHQGVQEAQGFALLGVRPVRDRRGRISRLDLIPREELGRPRVDVVFHATSLYRDTFPMIVMRIDEAVRLAATSPEADNAVRNNARALRRQLMADGMAEADADRRSLMRIFAEPTGKHDSKVFAMTHASGSWDDQAQVAENYIRRMGHGYGGGAWGEPVPTVFRAALKDTDVIIHSRASNLYATLDNDDYFSYGGSIALGVRRANGSDVSPPFFVTDLRTPGRERHETLERFMGQELRARTLNPDFARETMREGYAGARDIWKTTDYLWGWQVVYPEAVDAAKWQELHDIWLADRHQLGIEAFFKQHNPHARQGMASRMLETVRKGYWQPGDATMRNLAQVYLESLVADGIACDHLSCDNPELQEFVADEARRLDAVPPGTLAAARATVEQVTRRTIADALSQRLADRQRWHGPQTQTADAAAGNDAEPTTPRTVTGYKMEEAAAEHSAVKPPAATKELDRLALIFGAVLLVCGGLGGGRRRRTIAG